uniref:Cullin family profile domain-containing protein n=1 Tax=Panagrolaimus davidi TaxID=227884 RepID=A0A914Q2K8_9BILA
MHEKLKEQLTPVFKLFFELGSDNRKFYEDQFETIFLQKVAKFYQFTSKKYLNNACEYVRNIYEFVNAEEKYADKLLDKFLDPMTHPKWKNIIIQKLITTNIQKVIENKDTGLVFLLKNDCFGEMNLLHCLLKRVPNVTKFNVAPVLNQIEDHVIKYIRNCWRNDFVKINEFLCSQNFNGYIQSLYELEQKMDSFIKKYFKVQSELTAKVQAEILHLLNVDPKLLSLYIDHYLKKGLKNDNENDRFDILERAVNVFKYITDKDIFEKYYKQHLTKRLIFDKSSSNEAEKFVISRMKMVLITLKK